MKIARWYNNRDIRIEEIPRPDPGPEEMLIKVISCGICGSDIVEWYRLPRAPLIPGHEIGAEVVTIGKSVDRFKPGDRVFVAPKVACMQCEQCKNGRHPLCSTIKDRLPGGFAEYILVPKALTEKGTYLLPGSISYDESTFIEPLACVIRAQRLAALRANQVVMVIGCGMSGLLHVKLAGSKGCRIIATDVKKNRLEAAGKFGAGLTLKTDEVSGYFEKGNKKPDAVILCTGAVSAVEQAWQSVDKGGAIVFFAVPAPDKKVTIPINDFWMKEIRILTSYYCGPQDIADAIEYLDRGQLEVEDMITHRLPLEEIAEGYRLVTEGAESIKVIIRPV
jgi:L-iditol 2-dehydrogenase